MKYNFNIQHIHFDPTTGLHTEVGVDTSQKYGWFEQCHIKGAYDIHLCEGGLWFEASKSFLELVDQDGTTSLPKTVGWILRHLGFLVDTDFE